VIAYGSVLDIPIEEWDRVLNVNLRGVYLGLQACGRRIAEAGGGSIVVTASSAGLLGTPGASAYAASKHGVLGLMKSAAADLAPLGIRVNAVCPGVIDTPLLGPLHGQTDMLQSLLAPAHPIGRVGTANEVAAVVAFLASDDSSFMTGASVAVDGGVSSVLMGMGTATDKAAQG
jgi:NAD(P)-dependent dehydrogenase (short-subunit alcohol dehydrogenase family)